MRAITALFLLAALPLSAFAAASSTVASTTIESSAGIFAVIDSARVRAAAAVEGGITWAKAQIGNGATSGSGYGLRTLWTIGATIALYALTILLYIIVHVVYFYIALGIILLYILFKLLRR